MSVLYKALARAAKAREAARPGPDVSPAPSPLGRAPKRRSRLRIALFGVAAALVVAVGGLVLFGDDIASMVDAVLSEPTGVPSPPLPPSIPRSRQTPPVASQTTAPAAGPGERPAPQSAGTQVAVVAPEAARPAAPAPQPAQAPQPSPAPAPVVTAVPATAPSPPTAPAQQAAAPAQPLPPAAPPAVQPAVPVVVAPTIPAVPAAAPAPVAASAPAAPAAAVSKASPPAPPPAPAAPGHPPVAAKPAPPAVEEDLPAILDRIRRQKSAPAIAQPVTVNRQTATADLTGAGGQSAVSVAVTAPTEREEAKTAYDMLLHGQYEGALALYEKSLKTAPTSVPLLLGKATAEHKLRRYYDARETYRQVLAVDADNREALTNMTAIVANQAPEQALAELKSLQRTYPSFSPISAQIAAIEAGRGNAAGAVAALGSAIALSPDNGLYRLNLAILQDRAGMAAEAAASYQAALDLLGSNDALPVPVEQIRQRLKYLQGR